MVPIGVIVPGPDGGVPLSARKMRPGQNEGTLVGIPLEQPFVSDGGLVRMKNSMY